MPNLVSVILPIHKWVENTQEAIASILNQSHDELELLLITNGDETNLRDRAERVCDEDKRVRAFHLDDASLPRALNLGIANARSELVARMDADDWSHPERIASQAEFMRTHPELAGCATATKMIGADDRVDHIHTPPITPEQARWRVLVWNPFVHGSMMLRRSSIEGVGGYNETLDRAQDYDLWIRLAEQGIGGIPDVLYKHTMNADTPSHGLDARQSIHSAQLLLRAWERLQEGDSRDIEHILAQLMVGDEGARAQLETHLEVHGPSRSALNAWLWSCWRHPIARTSHTKRDRVIQRANEQLEESRCSGVWLWGAGDFARAILAMREPFAVPILGVLDDHRAGQRIGAHTIEHPEHAPIDPESNEAVFIASDLYAEQIFERSAPLRSRGVLVLGHSEMCGVERVR
jgi:GT2 family glycosyltransferase